MGKIVGKGLLEHFHQLFVKQVTLGNGEHTLFAEHVGIEGGKLIEQDIVLLADIVGVTGNHEEQQRVALDVTKKSQAKALTGASTLDDTGDIGHYKRTVVTIRHDTEVGLKGGKGIVGNLGLGGRHGSQEGRLTCIREAHETDIGQKLELHNDSEFLHGLARLRKARSLTGGCSKVKITQAATTTTEEDDLLSMFGDVAKVSTRLCVINNSAAGNLDYLVFAILTATLVL